MIEEGSIEMLQQELHFGYTGSLPQQIETVLQKFTDIAPDTKDDLTTLLQLAYNQGILDGIAIAEQSNKKERTNIVKNAQKNEYKFKTDLFIP